MPNDQDPRNIFVNQRHEYSEKQRSSEYSSGSNQRPGDSSNQSKSANNPNSASHSGSNANSQTEYERKVEEMKRLAAKYEREGEGQLVKDIVNNVIEQKARGALTNEQLLAFAKRISPLLNAEQRSRLDGLVEQLLKL